MTSPFLAPGDGFEPPLKEPESFVLPLDDPGLFHQLYYHLKFRNTMVLLLTYRLPNINCFFTFYAINSISEGALKWLTKL